MEPLEELLRLVPAGPDWRIDWQKARETALWPWLEQMARTEQNPVYHGEGDVWTHTRMVCEALAGMEDFRRLPEKPRQLLFLAALMHDLGKIPCTRLEGGNWTSPNHALAGAGMARELLWLEYGLCGTPERQRFRETVCALIRYHSLPVYAVREENGVRRLRRAAANGALLPEYSLELQCLLARADMEGRRSRQGQDAEEYVQLCRELAAESGCAASPYPFPSDFTAYQYLSGRNPQGEYPLYDDTWGEVILLSGLPGTGKDTWLGEHCPGLPVISLDDIRRELQILPTQRQERVAEEARSRAKALLRARRPFVWNATNLTGVTRQRQVELFASYHARVRIVYLETGWEEELRRNRGRRDMVPEGAIRRMLAKLTPPERWEAHRVEWYCI